MYETARTDLFLARAYSFLQGELEADREDIQQIVSNTILQLKQADRWGEATQLERDLAAWKMGRPLFRVAPWPLAEVGE